MCFAPALCHSAVTALYLCESWTVGILPLHILSCTLALSSWLSLPGLLAFLS
jgi:hypothetical protein